LTELQCYSEEFYPRPPDRQQCITDAGLAHLQTLTQLENLDLFGHDLSDASATNFTKMTKLKTLALSGHGFTDLGLRNLANLPLLRTLRLFETSVTTNGTAELEQRLPGIEVNAWNRE
jgi:Leucine-rich repeat (LRR) protein